MKLINELILFAIKHNKLTEEHKRLLQKNGFYTFYRENDESYDYYYDHMKYEQDAYSLEDDELDRTYYGDYYHPGKRYGRRHHGKRKSRPASPILTVEELNQRVQEDWKKLTEEFPRIALLWDSWKAGKLMRVLSDRFTLNDVYALMNVDLQDFHDYSGPVLTAYRQLLRQVGNTVGKYSWVIKNSETASMVEFHRFRHQILEEVRALYETDREKFGVLSSQNGELNFPYWEKAVHTDTTSMKAWSVLNLSSTPVTPDRIEEILTWKPVLTIAMQMDLDYMIKLLIKQAQRDWSSLIVITERKIENTILKSVAIPEWVTEIENRAFEDCSSLTSVAIPEGVKAIGDSAFKLCSSLISVTIPKGVAKIGGRAFLCCRSLKFVSISEGVTEIENSAFEGCRSLKSVAIPEGVTRIGDYAFNGCSLRSVVIPKSVNWIGRYAFNRYPKLTILAPAGSYAEQYAKNNNISFLPYRGR